MGKNYKETRERLRRLLHKKKTKRRTAPNVNAGDKIEKAVVGPVVEKPVLPAATPPVPAVVPLRAQNQELTKKSRSLEDLLDFIEGNESACRNEKKAAKRARQKEKKLQLILQLKREEEERVRQLEEERLRKEREAEMLENLRKAAAKKKKSKKKKKKDSIPEVQNNQQLKKANFSLGQSGASNPGAQMVTIKRVMEPHDSEPTVTITLRGATPKQDKVLYTLFNGKVCESLKNPKGPKNPKDLKNIKETEKNTVTVKKVAPQKMQPPNLTASRIEPKVQKSNLSYQMSNPRPSKELTNPTSIQISNAVTNMTKNGYHDFNFDGIKLPPGITITKVDPCHTKIKSTSKMEEDSKNQVSLKPVPKPPKKAPTPEVIIVSTNKLKQEANPTSRTVKPDISKLSASCSGISKKQKKKKENDLSSKSKMASSYPGLDIEIIKPTGDQTAAELCNQMSVLTINPYADCKGDESEQPVKTSKKKRKKKKKSKADTGAEAEDWNTLVKDSQQMATQPGGPSPTFFPASEVRTGPQCLYNVFAPKDLDLNDGEIDDAERELEAFKLFCMQSVPLKRKEKVNLNLKDLILKKKSVSCS